MSGKASKFTLYERESLRLMGRSLQIAAADIGKKHRKNPDMASVFASLHALGVAVERFADTNGHMEIWAAFTPDLFDYSESDEGYGSD